MAGEIIYVCNSINNKNVREGELKILRKVDKELYFEFGESEINLKKRFYKDEKTLNKDFNKLMDFKEKSEQKDRKLVNQEIEEEVYEEIEKPKKIELGKKSII